MRAHHVSHQKSHGMLLVLQARFFWNGMRKDIKDFVIHSSAGQTSAPLITADGALDPIPVLRKDPESSAFVKYAEPTEDHQQVPQGDRWIGQKVQKLFSHPQTGKMTIYSGEVKDFLVTRVGQERVHIIYEDGDSETCEASNAIPWTLLEPDVTLLEAHSRIEKEGLERIAFMYLSMLETFGSLRADASLLAQKDAQYVREFASSFSFKAVPAGLEIDPDPGPKGTVDTEALTESGGILADKENMDSLVARGILNNAQTHARQARAYAKRKRSRNKHVETLEVGSPCRISPPIDANASGKAKIVWSPDIYRVESFERGRVVVEKVDNPAAVHNLVAQCVLPIAEPAQPIFMSRTSA